MLSSPKLTVRTYPTSLLNFFPFENSQIRKNPNPFSPSNSHKISPTPLSLYPSVLGLPLNLVTSLSNSPLHLLRGAAAISVCRHCRAPAAGVAPYHRVPVVSPSLSRSALAAAAAVVRLHSPVTTVVARKPSPLCRRYRVWSKQLQSATISSSSRCHITSWSSPSPSTRSISFSIPTTAPNSRSLSPPPCCCSIVVQDRHRLRHSATPAAAAALPSSTALRLNRSPPLFVSKFSLLPLPDRAAVAAAL